MKEIIIAYIITTFVMLLMIGLGLCLIIHRTNSVLRMATEQRDFDHYEFIMPDGERFTPFYDFVE